MTWTAQAASVLATVAALLAMVATCRAREEVETELERLRRRARDGE